MDNGDIILRASHFLATVFFNSSSLWPIAASPKLLFLVNLL
jgi:hypothetical protein